MSDVAYVQRNCGPMRMFQHISTMLYVFYFNLPYFRQCYRYTKSVYVSVRTHLNGRNNVLFAEKCIRLVCEKLTIFLYGQDIAGNVVSLAFCRYSQVQDRSGVLEEMYKNVTVISRKMDLPHESKVQGHTRKKESSSF